jgi:hypothetical protein
MAIVVFSLRSYSIQILASSWEPAPLPPLLEYISVAQHWAEAQTKVRRE